MPARFLTFLILLLAAPALFAFDDDFLMPDEAFKPTVTADGNTITASWEIAEGYYLYKEKFRFESQTPEITLGEPQFPPAEMHHGIKPNGEEGEVEVYFNEVTVSIPVTSGSAAADVLVRYQGCAEKGLCYPPQKKNYTLEVASAPAPVATTAESPALGATKTGGLQSLSGDLGLGFQDDILPADQAMEFEAIVLDGRKLQAIWRVADDVYMYADKITLALEGDAALGEYSLPEPEIKWGLKPDGTEGNIPVYHGTVRAEIPLKRPLAGETTVSLRAGYQGCAEQGVCYPPQKKVIELLLPAVATADAAEPASREEAPSALATDAAAAAPVAASEEDGLFFEKRVLKPMQPRDEYNRHHGFTPFDMASSALGMRRKAFDLMVAKNCEIFRSVGKFSQRWYLSDLYLRELSQKEYFDLISAKYELMARRLGQSRGIDDCMI